MGAPAGGEADPRAQVAGDLEDFALLVEVDSVDGEAHEAHVDAVARRNKKSRHGWQWMTKHQANQACPEGVGNMNLDFTAVIWMDKNALLHAVNHPFRSLRNNVDSSNFIVAEKSFH